MTAVNANAAVPQQIISHVLHSALRVLDMTGSDMHAMHADLEGVGVGHVNKSGATAIADLLSQAERAVLQGSRAVHQELERYRDGLEWNHVVVALHGETNAGKSALIEALTGGLGTWIGNGRKDYTERPQSRPWEGMLLLDTPGIEGRERDLLQEIERALAKAHVVLLLLDGKELEVGTLRKIQYHTRRASHVFSVLNQRAHPSAYRYLTELLDPDTARQIVRIQSKLTSVFGARYRGHLTVHALLALLSHGRPLEARFQPDRQKAIEIFGSLQAIRGFSGLPGIESMLRRTSREASALILESNLHRTGRALDEACSELTQAQVAMRRGGQRWRQSIADVQPAVERMLQHSKRSIELRIESEIQALSVTLKSLLQQGIDDELTWPNLDPRIREATRAASAKLTTKVRAELDRLENDVHGCLDRLSARLHLYTNLEPDLTGVGNVLAELARAGTRQILDHVLSAIGVFASWALNPVLGAVSAALTGLRKLWEWRGGGRDRRLRERKARANDAIDASLTRLRSRHVSELDQRWAPFAREVEAELKRVTAIGDRLDGVAQKIQQRIDLIKRERARLDALSQASRQRGLPDEPRTTLS